MSGKALMCFGDSLTWGRVPNVPPLRLERYPREGRWPRVLADRLGEEYVVIEEAICGRTTTADDPFDSRVNGSAYLPAALASHVPLDLVIIMLGTNDTKAYLRRTPLDIAAGMATLVAQVLRSTSIDTGIPTPKVLVVAPPPLGRIVDAWSAMVFSGAHDKFASLAEAYRAMASSLGVSFFDAASVISTDGVDGIHLTEQNNLDLGVAIASEVRAILARKGLAK